MDQKQNRNLRKPGFRLLLPAGIGLLLLAVLNVTGQELPGFDDTPYLPGGKWRVHDSQRPRPAVVVPPTPSTQEEPGRPPSDAVVLFDGTDLSGWYTRNDDDEVEEARWKVEDGYMEVVGGAGSIISKEEFGDCQVHVEWAAPSKVEGTSQGRGNSGVILMGFYEIQVLDSYENMSYADGQASAMYGQFPPLVNASRPPGHWQTYDIVFEAPVFRGEDLVEPARVTVFHNGVLVHNHRAFIGRMTYRQLATYSPHGPAGPLMLQDHGNPVRYRNIWVRPLESGAE